LSFFEENIFFNSEKKFKICEILKLLLKRKKNKIKNINE